MQYAGIVVIARGGCVADVAARLELLPGAEVYVRDDAAGRLVVVQEAADVEAHEALFRQIQALPGVVAAELACHVDDAEVPVDAPDEPNAAPLVRIAAAR